MTPDPRAVEALQNAIGSLSHGRCCWDPTQDAADILAALPDGWTLVGPEQQAALADGVALRALQDTTGEQEGRWERSPGSQFSQFTIVAAADAAREALP